jgi:hypothetical protein
MKSITRQSHDNRLQTSTNDRSKHQGADSLTTTTELQQSGKEKDVIKLIVEVINLVISAPDARKFAKHLWKEVKLYEQFGHEGSLPNSN